MSYNYQTERPGVFTEDGSTALFQISQTIQKKCQIAGACRASEAWESVNGNTHALSACLDRLVELGLIREIRDESASLWHRVFVLCNEEGR